MFVSGDRDIKSFKEYFAEMPWIALNYDLACKGDLNETFKCQGIPYLVAIDAKTGELLTNQGRTLVMTCGSGFPRAALNAKKNKLEAEKKLKDLSILGSNITDKDDKSVDISGSDCVVVAFGNPSNQGWAQFVRPKLLTAYDELKKSGTKVEVVYISEQKDEEKSGPWAFIPSGTNSNLFSALGDMSAPNVLVLLKNSAGEFEIATSDASRILYEYGTDAYPWNEEGVKNGIAKKKARQLELAKKMVNFDLLKSVSIKDKQGKDVDIETLKKTEIVGLYFSAHWCGPCRGFTPQLASLYNECKAKNKSFEIVFVSSDRDQSAFEEYFREMPWTALDFKERDLKASLSEIYGVSGIPTLVLLKGDGTMLDSEGRKIVQLGADCYPWDAESIKRHKLAAQKKEEAMVLAAKMIGDVVLRRECFSKLFLKHSFLSSNIYHIKHKTHTHIGETGDFDGALRYVGKNTYDLSCKSFDTFATDSGGKAKGKWYYEVNLTSVSEGVAQIGFADEEFEPSSGNDGVGDDEHSWGFDGNRVCKWNNGATKYGKSWKSGDVLGCAIDLDGSTSDGKYVEFYLNGKSLGKAFTNISVHGSVCAAVTGHGRNYAYSVNFSKNTKFAVPSGFKTWGEGGLTASKKIQKAYENAHACGS